MCRWNRAEDRGLGAESAPRDVTIAAFRFEAFSHSVARSFALRAPSALRSKEALA